LSDKENEETEDRHLTIYETPQIMARVS